MCMTNFYISKIVSDIKSFFFASSEEETETIEVEQAYASEQVYSDEPSSSSNTCPTIMYSEGKANGQIINHMSDGSTQLGYRL